MRGRCCESGREGIVSPGRPAALKSRIFAIVLLAALAPGLPGQQASWGVRAGAGAGFLTGRFAGDLRGELEDLGAASVVPMPYLSWRAGGWVEIPVSGLLSVRVEPVLGPAGGALLASDGYDMLVGITGFELSVPVLAATRLALPVGELVLGAGVFVAGGLEFRQIRNDGAIRLEGDLASVLACLGFAGGVGYEYPVGRGALAVDLRVLGSVLSLTDPQLNAPLHTLSIELTAGWAFRPRGVR